MAISDDDYAAWLADDNAERLILAELSYRDINSGTDGVEYVATMPYITADTDTPALQLYDDIILEVPSITRRLPEQLFGASEVSYGDLTIDNANGELDDWFDLAFEGRSIVLYLGDPTWEKADFRRIFVGTVEDVTAPDEDVVQVRLRDNMWFLNFPIVTAVVGGNGPQAGEQEPICIGGCFNVEAILYSSSAQTYKLSKGPIEEVVDVRDNGASLVSDFTAISWVNSTNLFTWTAHGMSVDTRVRFLNATLSNIVNGADYWVIADGLTADNFKLSQTKGGSAFDVTGTFATGGATAWSLKWNDDLANGRITLVEAPAGRITADIKGVLSTDSPTEWVRTIADAIIYLVTNYTSLPLEFLDASDLQSFDFKYPVSSGDQPTIGLRISGGETVADLIAQLVSTAFAFFTFDREGVLRVGRVFSPEGGDITHVAVPTPVSTFNEDDVSEDAGISHLRKDNVLGVLETGFFRNWTPMPDGVAESLVESYPYAASLLRSEYILEGGSGGIAIEIPPDNHLGAVFEIYPLAERQQQLTLLSATDWEPMNVEGNLSDDGGVMAEQAQLWRTYWLNLRRKPRVTFQLPVNAEPFGLNLGDVSELDYPRLGFDGGANAIVTGIIEQPDSGTATLEIWK